MSAVNPTNEPLFDPESDSSSSSGDDIDDIVQTTHRMTLSRRNFPQSSQTSAADNGEIIAKYEGHINDQVKYARVNKDKSDRATVENAIDPKTFKQMQKLITNGMFTKIDGCLSTGKEANIYYAVNELTGKEYAIKVYKTSVLVFKDRERYINGEFRFKSFKNSNKINARRLIKVWSEKEFRNLRRLKMSGFNVPEAYELRSNILVMEFLGKEDNEEGRDNQENEKMKEEKQEKQENNPLQNNTETSGWPAPRLKDYTFTSEEETVAIYKEVVINMRLMYHKCRLIHADLSEYNLIMHHKKLYIIDVSQSIEPSHPMAIDFLRMDIKNINDFFSKKLGIDVFMEQQIFKFVTEDFDEIVKWIGSSDGSADEKEYLQTVVGKLKIKQGEEDEIEDEVFRNLHLMRELGDLEEEDFERFAEGKIDVFKTMVVKEKVEEDEDEEETEEEREYDELDEDKKLRGKKYEDKDEKKLRKKLVKEQNQEKRKVKMKKSVKHRLVRKTKKK